jgi:DNA-binding cell septation regulator SpoVG
MKIKIEEITLKFKILDDKKTKAIISLGFDDFSVKGFRITESQFPNMNGDNLWFMPPSYPGGGRYHPIFFMPDKELWKELEKRVWEEYKIKNKEYYSKKMGLDEEESKSI